MRRSVSYIITVKTPYKSTRRILLRGEAKLSVLAECILDAYGIVRDRAYFFFTGSEPWEGTVYTDTAEFDKEFSAYRVSVSHCMDEGERFLFQIGYDPEFVFSCKAEMSERAAKTVPEIVSSSGGTASEFLPVEEEGEEPYDGEDAEPVEEEEYEDLPEADLSYSPLELTVDAYLRAAVSLYGVLLKTKAREIILSYEPTLTEEKIKEAFRNLPLLTGRNDYVMSGREIMYTELADFQTGEYFALKKAQWGKAFYLPEKEEFLRYADTAYFEKNSEYLALEAQLKDILPAPEKTAEDIYRMLAGGLSAEEAVSVAEKVCRHGLDSPSVAEAVKALSAKVRRWENRGNY